jgi:hypothetical protein
MRARLAAIITILLASMLLLVAPASAGSAGALKEAITPARAPYGLCGNSFILKRSGSTVRVVGVGLDAYSSGYMLVYASDGYGHGWGPYNASPRGGASFSLSTGRTSKQTINISLTDDGNHQTLCTDSYFV